MISPYFIKIKCFPKTEILLNFQAIESIEKTSDGAVFINTISASQHRLISEENMIEELWQFCLDNGISYCSEDVKNQLN